MNRSFPLSVASSLSELEYASVLPYQEDASSINIVLDVTDTLRNEISADVHIFHQVFVNVDDPDSDMIQEIVYVTRVLYD